MAISRRPKSQGINRARLRFVVYAAKLLAPRGVLMLLVTVVGGLIYQARVVPEKKTDFVAACFEIYTQLFFEHGESLPKDSVLRVLFFVVPLIGAVVLAEGVLKLGASLFDFNTHREKWMVMMAQSQKDHVILVGLGHIGFRVYEELTERGIPVVIIEQNEGGAFVEEAKANGAPVITGDARRKSILHDAGIENARSLICCTDDDLANLEVALDARAANPDVRLVTRMFEQSMAQKLRKAFELDNTLSTSEIAAPLFAAAALDENVFGAYRLGQVVMVSLEVPVSSAHNGKSVAQFGEMLSCPMVGVHRKGHEVTHLFKAHDALRTGDAVICHVPATEIGEVYERLEA